ncbi:MAG: diacylglycerol kinase family protein [Hansschlegelia sp.]
MSKLGVVANARSWKNRGAGPTPPKASDLIFEAPGSPADYPEVMRRFAESGVTTVAIDGGDGTLRDVLTAMADAYPDGMPAVALAPSGKTNVAAADVGGVRRGADRFERLLTLHRSGAAAQGVVRRPIEISFDDRRLLGFVFGLGAFEKATGLVDARVHNAGFAQKLGVALGVIVSGAAAIGGKDKEVWRRGAPISIAIDGGPSHAHDSFAVLATSLKRWVLGLWPFWGAGDGAIALTEVDAPPRRLALGLATAGIGRPRPWAESEGWRSVRADSVTLALSEAFIIDGDRFMPGPDGAVALRAGPPVTFIRP